MVRPAPEPNINLMQHKDPLPELMIQAPAKINLGLEILRRRADGYHDINTVFAAVGIFDEITLHRRMDGRIICRVEGNPELETGEDNLCVRAAKALREAIADDSHGLDITLLKRIPMGAGLGGGSSDAAAVLAGAARLWELRPERELLHDIAAGLGSDVPFFLLGGFAHAASRGEVLAPVELQLPYGVLLVNPGIHVPTPWAYRAVGRTGEQPATDLTGHLRNAAGNAGLLREHITNDFEEAVFTEHPVLPELKRRLYDAGAVLALMSGSGSTMFGLFSTPQAAELAAPKFSEYWTCATRFVR